MKRTLSLVLIVCLAFLGLPSLSLAAQLRQQPGSVSGVARDASGNTLAGFTVHLRNVSSGQVVASVVANAKGEFTFAQVPAGTYVVEAVDGVGKIVSTTRWITVNAGAPVTGANIGRDPSLGGATAARVKGFFTSTAGVLVMAAAGAGVGVAVYQTRKSPSK